MMQDETALQPQAMGGGEVPQAAAKPEKVEPSEEVKKLVALWTKRVKDGEEHAKPAFDRIRRNMEVARLGADKAWVASDKYTVPIVLRHINQSVATLYAKNPQPQAKRRKRLEYQIWDGTLSSLQAAKQSADSNAQMGLPPDPQGVAMLQEIMSVKQQNQMLDRVGKTLEYLFSYYTSEEEPNFIIQMKQLVRRTKVCGVSYMWLDFQRLMEPQPEVSARIEDTVSKIERVKVLMKQLADDEIQEGSAELAELQSNLADLQNDEYIILREGPVVGFPAATEIVLDPKTRQIRGLVGTGWVAYRRHFTPDEAQEVYGVDLGKDFKPYYSDGKGGTRTADAGETARDDSIACFWEVWHKKNKQTFVICDGYKDFIVAPATPKCMSSRFWPLYPLVFNDVEVDPEEKGAVYPLSDIEILAHPQKEYNRARETLRQHRIANTPQWVAPTGALEDKDKQNLGSADAHILIELNGLQNGQKVDEILQRKPTQAIDVALYDVNGVMQDVERSIGGAQENIGGNSNGTATSSSIAESSRSVAAESNVNDLDECLSELAAGMSEIMLLELSAETVTKIVGPGAVWPQMTAQDVAEQIYLDIKAGSSGKPNRAAELANMERGLPLLLQLPGVNPTPLAEKYASLLEIEIEDLIIEGIPSITAMNALAGRQVQPGTGDPATDPNAQGAEGGQNATKPGQNSPPGQAAHPAADGLPPVGAPQVPGGLPAAA